MAPNEHRARYVGTWRADNVCNLTIRQILARLQTVNGQKVKIRLSAERGLTVTKTAIFQESTIASIPLHEVYFLTTYHQLPTSLLCVAADPVRAYLIMAFKLSSQNGTHDIILRFKELVNDTVCNAKKNEPKNKGKANWTLRERIQQNVDLHLQEISKCFSSSSSISDKNNVFDYYVTDSKSNESIKDGSLQIGNYSSNSNALRKTELSRMTTNSFENVASKSATKVKHIPQNVDQNSLAGNVNDATKFEEQQKSDNVRSDATKDGSITGRIAQDGIHISNCKNVTESSENRVASSIVHHITKKGHVVCIPSTLRTALPDKPVITNGRINREITVPSFSSKKAHSIYSTDTSYRRLHPIIALDHTRLDYGNNSTCNSLRSSVKVTFKPQMVGRCQLVKAPSQQHHSFHVSHHSKVPNTVVRPIEKVYGRRRDERLRTMSRYVIPVYHMPLADTEMRHRIIESLKRSDKAQTDGFLGQSKHHSCLQTTHQSRTQED